MLIGLNAEWYAKYPRSGFHFFNDYAEWLQVDKVGHAFSAYSGSRASMEAMEMGRAFRENNAYG